MQFRAANAIATGLIILVVSSGALAGRTPHARSTETQPVSGRSRAGRHWRRSGFIRAQAAAIVKAETRTCGQ